MCLVEERTGGQAATSQVLSLIEQDPNLPVLPATALEVLDKASRPESTMAEIAVIIGRDPALAVKILKTINSSLFGLPRSVSSIERALQFLGLKPVRSLVLSFSLPMMYRSATPADGLANFWKASVAGAMIARELSARLARPEVDDDFTAALLRDVGMLILEQTTPDDYAAILNQRAEVLAEHQCDLEQQQIGVDHAEVAAYILNKWRMPNEVTAAIRYHHAPNAAPVDLPPVVIERAHLLHFSSLAAQLLVTPQCTNVRNELFQVAHDRYRMSEKDLVDFLMPLNGKIEEFATVLNVTIGPMQNFYQVLTQATHELARIALETGAENVLIREEKREIEKQAQQWRRKAYRLRRQAFFDPLTGVYNRGYFEETLVTEFKRANRRCSVLGLIFLDLDGFKKLNDGFGHLFGDQVLKEVAQCLRREVRSGDSVARYGGDEFCIIVGDTTQAAVQTLGDRLLVAINRLVIRRAGNEGKVGASVGGVVCLPRRGKHTYEDFLAAADRAMYAAKTTGKNQVSIVSLLGPEDLTVIQEIERRLFDKYLLESGIATEPLIREAIRQAPSAPYCIGRMARRLSWIAPRKLKRVLAEQRESKRMFGEIAIERGWLTATQVYGLLAMQRQRPEDIMDGLIDLEAIDEPTGQLVLKTYYKKIASML